MPRSTSERVRRRRWLSAGNPSAALVDRASRQRASHNQPNLRMPSTGDLEIFCWKTMNFMLKMMFWFLKIYDASEHASVWRTSFGRSPFGST